MLKLDPNSRASIPEIVGHNWMRQDLHNKRLSQSSLTLPSRTATSTATVTCNETLPLFLAQNASSLLGVERPDPITEGGKSNQCVAATERTAECTNNPTPDEPLRPPDSRESRERANHVVDSVARSLKCDASDNLSAYFSSDGEPLLNMTDFNMTCSSSSKSHRNDLPSVQCNSSGSGMKASWPLLELSPLMLGELVSEPDVSPLASARRTHRGSPSQSSIPSPRNLITPDRSSSTGRRVRSNEELPSDTSYLDPDPTSQSGPLFRAKSRRGNLSKCRSSSGFLVIIDYLDIKLTNFASHTVPISS